MLVILLPRSGHTARRVFLQPIQTVSVGSSHWADVSVTADQRMAPVHFRVTADQKSAWVRHLGQGKATYLNGNPVQHQVLAHGDVIVAGSTEYVVHIETAGGGSSQSVPAATGQRPSRLSVARRLLADGSEYVYGEDSTPDAALALLERIARRTSVYLVVNLAHADVPEPRELAGTPDLLDSLPEPLRQLNSLHCVPFDAGWRGLFRQLWGKDALVALISPENPERQLRSALGSYCRPSFLRREVHVSHRLARLLGTAQALLIEAEGAGWELFRSPSHPPSWQSLDISVADRG